MAPVIYGFKGSPPYRACLLTIEALGIDVEFEEVNTGTEDHLKPEFLQLNPLHTVPTFRDGDFIIWDSHVINAYLVGKYGKDDSLYPKDLQKRAVVDQRMYFDVEILFAKLRAVIYPILKQGAKSIDGARAADLEDAYNSLETLLERSTYVAGEQLTIADYSIVSTLTTADLLVPIALDRYPKISKWLVKMQALPYYGSANQVGLEALGARIKSFLA